MPPMSWWIHDRRQLTVGDQLEEADETLSRLRGRARLHVFRWNSVFRSPATARSKTPRSVSSRTPMAE